MDEYQKKVADMNFKSIDMIDKPIIGKNKEMLLKSLAHDYSILAFVKEILSKTKNDEFLEKEILDIFNKNNLLTSPYISILQEIVLRLRDLDTNNSVNDFVTQKLNIIALKTYLPGLPVSKNKPYIAILDGDFQGSFESLNTAYEMIKQKFGRTDFLFEKITPSEKKIIKIRRPNLVGGIDEI